MFLCKRMYFKIIKSMNKTRKKNLSTLTYITPSKIHNSGDRRYARESIFY